MLIDKRYDFFFVKVVLLRPPFSHKCCISAIKKFAIFCAYAAEDLFKNKVGDCGRTNVFPSRRCTLKGFNVFIAAIETDEHIIGCEKQIGRIGYGCALCMEPVFAS